MTNSPYTRFDYSSNTARLSPSKGSRSGEEAKSECYSQMTNQDEHLITTRRPTLTPYIGTPLSLADLPLPPALSDPSLGPTICHPSDPSGSAT